MKKLYIAEIETQLENAEIPDKLHTILSIFLSSINDWPSEISTLCDYENEVKMFIRTETTRDNIESSLKHINFEKNSWEAESLAQILDVFQFYKNGYTLKEIINDINNKMS